MPHTLFYGAYCFCHFDVTPKDGFEETEAVGTAIGFATRLRYLRHQTWSWLVRNAFTKEPSSWPWRRKAACLDQIPSFRNLHSFRVRLREGAPCSSDSVHKMVLLSNKHTHTHTTFSLSLSLSIVANRFTCDCKSSHWH